MCSLSAFLRKLALRLFRVELEGHAVKLEGHQAPAEVFTIRCVPRRRALSPTLNVRHCAICQY